MKRLHPLLLTLALSAAVLGGCSTGTASSPSVAPSVDGRTFLSTDVTGTALVPGSRIRLTFADGSISASGGCNSMTGAYTISGDRLATGQLAMTAMGCEQPLMDQDQWLARLLAGSTLTLTGDTLSLDDGAIRLTLLDRKVASPDKPLAGTRWVLEGIVTGDAVSSVPAGVTAEMRIVDGRLELDAGCNRGGGSVTVEPTTMTFGPIGLTKMACEAGPATVESAVVSTLEGTVDYAIEAEVLTIDGGATGLVFRAAAQ